MRKYFLILVVLLVFNHLYAQKIELSVQAYSGLFHYSGNGTAADSYIHQGQADGQDYTINPYGNKNAFSYGAGIQAQHITKGGFIVGGGANYEILRSKVNINGYVPNIVYEFYTIDTYYPNKVSGSSFLQDQTININPYIGYRIIFKGISIDLLPGADFSFNLNAYDKGKATSTYPPSAQVQQTYQTNFKRPDAPTDVRLRFGLAANYKRISVTASYAHGLTNYEKNMTGSNLNARSELIRFGLAYKLLH